MGYLLLKDLGIIMEDERNARDTRAVPLPNIVAVRRPGPGARLIGEGN